MLDTTLYFEILNQTSSDPGNMTTSSPFEITERDDGKSVEIRKTASYTPDPGKQVYFDIELEVTDNSLHKFATPHADKINSWICGVPP